MSHMLIFITDNVNELLIHDRREILQMIYNSQSRSKLKEKGGGTQIKLDDLSEQLTEKIYNSIIYVPLKPNGGSLNVYLKVKNDLATLIIKTTEYPDGYTFTFPYNAPSVSLQGISGFGGFNKSTFGLITIKNILFLLYL